MADYGVAVQGLADSLDGLQEKLGDEIKNLSDQIDTLANTTGQGDVGSIEGVTDGSIVELQYTINQMTKAAEAGASTFAKAEGVSKSVGRTLNQA
jgi:hypothetical protein